LESPLVRGGGVEPPPPFCILAVKLSFTYVKPAVELLPLPTLVSSLARPR
jgi:hypothetical protein